jgi:hypothetical protein
MHAKTGRGASLEQTRLCENSETFKTVKNDTILMTKLNNLVPKSVSFMLRKVKQHERHYERHSGSWLTFHMRQQTSVG